MLVAMLCAAGLAHPALAGEISPDLTQVQDFRLPDANMVAEQSGEEVMQSPAATSSAEFAGESCANPAEGRCADRFDLLGSSPQLTMPFVAYGPQDAAADASQTPPKDYRSFGSQVGAIKWEMAAVLTYYTAINGTKLFQDPTAPHFHKEGWFGKSTRNVGMDKLAHAYSAYVISDLIYGRLKRKTGNAPGIAFTAAAMATGTMLYTEFWDSIERSAGWSWEDVAFNSIGSGFSILRNSVPGLDKKLDYRMMVVPNSDIWTFEGKRHFEQQRFFFALKASGFKAFDNSPLRFLEFHLGYYGKDFTNEDRAMGIEPKRRVFVGFGVNLRELFFKNSKGRIGRAAGEVLDYFQPPYTAIHTHITN